MLVPVIFIFILVTTLAAALLESGLTTTKTARLQTVGRYADVAVANGVADFTAGLALYVSQHGSLGPWPTAKSTSRPKPLCAATVSAEQCPFTYRIEAAVLPTSPRAVLPWAGPDPATNVQTAIDEHRIPAVVTVTVASHEGRPLASRTRFLTYRVFAAAPYAIVASSLDTTTVNAALRVSDGDIAGTSVGPRADSAELSATGGELRDPRIHAQLTCATVIPNLVPLVNDQQVAGNDGLPWGNAQRSAYEVACETTASAADAFADESWTNGTAPASGWTR